MKTAEAGAHRLRWAVFPFIGVMLLNCAPFETYAQRTTTYQQQQPKSQATSLVKLTECEQFTESCSTWTLVRGQGTARLPSGEIASLTYSRDGDRITFVRAQSEGPLAGVSVTYDGTIDENGVNGKFHYTWNGQRQSGNWYAYALDSAPLRPPDVMHLCLAHCQTWTLDKGAPYDKPHYGSVAAGGIVIVDSWTRESVLMHRTDYGQVPGAAVLTGKLSDDGYSIVDGNIAWTWHPCCGTSPTGRFVAAWGPKIESVPGVDGGTTTQVVSCDLDCLIRAGNTFVSGVELAKRISALLGNN